MECIDVITPEGQPTGVSKPREEIHRDGDWHRTIHVWIMNSHHAILLQKRSDTKENHPGLWDMACAGHISSGETSREAAVKEVREELGIRTSENDFQYLFSEPGEFVLNNGCYIDREIHDIYLMKADIPVSSFSIQTEEVSDLKYVTLAEFAALVERKDSTLVPHFSEFKRVIEHVRSAIAR